MNKNKCLCAKSGRRRLLAAGSALPVLAWTAAARAQTPAKVARIGLLTPSGAVVVAPLLQAFRLGLRDHGWIEGKNIAFEYRYADTKDERLPELAADLVRLKVDVIVATNSVSALAAQKASKTIPVVVPIAGNPVEQGMAKSLARPGGNITGLSQMTRELNGKRLELLKETFPKLSRVAVLSDETGSSNQYDWKELQSAARQLGVQLHALRVHSANDFAQAFEDAVKARVDGLFIMARPVISANLKRVADFAAKHRFPSVFPVPEFVEIGGLFSYGPDRADLFRRAAAYVDKILKGAKPGDLPFEQPTKFELVINMKTAKALGLTVPPPVLVQATRVIE